MKCEHAAKFLEWEQDFPLTKTGLKLLGFKPFERKDLSKWNFLYPSDSHTLHKNLGRACTSRGWISSVHLSSSDQEGAAQSCAFLSRAPCGKPVPGCHPGLGCSAGFTPGRISLPCSATNTCAGGRERFLCPL